MFKVNSFDDFSDVTLEVAGSPQDVDIVQVEFEGSSIVVWTRPLDYSDAFISEWEIENSTAQVIEIPVTDMNSKGIDCEVDWGDGNKDRIIQAAGTVDVNGAGRDPRFTHIYANPGTYTVRIAAPQIENMSFPACDLSTLYHHDKALIVKRLKKVKQLGIVGWESLKGLCYTAINLDSFVLGNHDTSKVTTTESMFENTNMSHYTLFDTSKVVTMEYMFKTCPNNISAELYDMSSNINMHEMFIGNAALILSPLYNTTSVENFSDAWSGCVKLPDAGNNAGNLDFSSATTLAGAWLSNHEIIIFPSIDIPNCLSVGSAWYDCVKMTTFNAFTNSSKVNDIGVAWRGTKLLKTFPVIDTSSVTNVNQSWFNSGQEGEFPPLDFGNVATMRETWQYTKITNDFANYDFSSVTDIYRTWQGCVNIVKFGPNVINSGGNQATFRDCTSLVCMDIKLTGTPGINLQQMFAGCPELRYIRHMETASPVYTLYAFLGANRIEYPTSAELSLILAGGYVYDSGFAKCEDSFKPMKFTIDSSIAGVSGVGSFKLPTVSSPVDYTVDWGDGNTDKITKWNAPETTHVYSSPGTHHVVITGMMPGFVFNGGGDKDKFISMDDIGFTYLVTTAGMFKGCINMTTFNVGVGKFSHRASSSSSMFAGAEKLTHVDLFDTSNFTNLSSMFENCKALPAMPLFDLAKATNLNSFMLHCESIILLPLFVFPEATEMDKAFAFTSITTIPDFDYPKVTRFSSTFNNTLITENPVSMATSIVAATVTAAMFSNCKNFTVFNTFDTSKVTNFQEMFNSYNANSPTSGYDGKMLTMPDLDYSSATNMRAVFLGQKLITKLGPIAPNQASVWVSTFEGMSALTCIKEINTTGSGSFGSMFSNTSALVNPTTIDQTKLITSGGFHYTKTTPCP